MPVFCGDLDGEGASKEVVDDRGDSAAVLNSEGAILQAGGR